jgi:hypothetical protein
MKFGQQPTNGSHYDSWTLDFCLFRRYVGYIPPPPHHHFPSDLYIKLEFSSIGFWKISEITARLSNNRFKPSVIQINYEIICA